MIERVPMLNDYACDACGAAPDNDGMVEHVPGCVPGGTEKPRGY